MLRLPPSIRHSLASWAEASLGFLYPNVCQLCHAETACFPEGYVGAQCRAEVHWITPPFCGRCGLPYPGEITNEFECSNCLDLNLQFLWARAAAVAAGPVREAIHRYKYNQAMWFENFLGQLFVQAALPSLSRREWDLIVPVPLHPVKLREREFNQAERLAARLAQATGIPLETSLLQRVEPTLSQALLSKKDRLQNTARAFAISPGRRLNGERVIVVDYVLTTGLTTSACAGILHRYGSGAVAVWTVARGL